MFGASSFSNRSNVTLPSSSSEATRISSLALASFALSTAVFAAASWPNLRRGSPTTMIRLDELHAKWFVTGTLNAAFETSRKWQRSGR